MPTAPPRACARCGALAQRGKPCQCRPAWENSTHPSGNDRHWQKISASYKRTTPICEWVDEFGRCRRTVFTVDHIVPLAEGGDRYAWTNLQSLCESHHIIKTTQDALRGKARVR